MKAKLIFNLPEDQEEYNRANSAYNLILFIWDFQGYLRGVVKYQEKPDDAERIYEKWFEHLSEHNINLDELIT